MPLFGAHCSTAGGLHNALTTAHGHGMDSVQIFTKNANQWAGKPLTDEDVALFKQTLRATKLKYPTAHDSYLINLASPDDALYRKSLEAFVDEVIRAERLGLNNLVMHPGAHMGAGEDVGLRRVAQALDEVHARCAGYKVKVLLEITAGQGTCLGHRFEHLALILSLVRDAKRLAVCFDTCHAYAAGYPLAPEENYRATMEECDRVIGLKRIKVFHLNDSKKPLGSRVDRHEHIGKGYLGREPFRLLVNDPRFAKLPMILETPKESDDNPDMDPVNLAVLRGLVG